MKINVVKFIIAILLAFLLSIICYVLAPTENYRNWISLAISAFTMLLLLIPALGLDYSYGYRTANIRLLATLGAIVVYIANIAFSCFMYSILMYVAILGIISLLFVALIYGLIPKTAPSQNENEVANG